MLYFILSALIALFLIYKTNWILSFFSSKPTLAIHTVFIAKENLPFIEEWILYHLYIGVDHIFLYDNTGSIGRENSTITTNKYGFNFHKLVPLSDRKIDRRLKNILAKYRGKTTLIKWQPLNNRGEIEYGYGKAVYHYIKNYGRKNTWTAFIDMDEFLYSQSHHDLKIFLQKTFSKGFSKIRIKQKKFEDRWLNLDKFVVDIRNCIDGLDTKGWGPKNIIVNNRFKSDHKTMGEGISMHDIPVKGPAAKISDKDLRFNHYNINPKQLEWMKGWYHTKDEFKFTPPDTGKDLDKYSKFINASLDKFDSHS